MKTTTFIASTIIFFFLAHYLAVFPHEFSHSIVAWLLGVKTHPLNIDYGGTSLSNLLLLRNIDEHNNYYLMYMLGKKHLIPLIAIAGPGMNGILYVISTYFLYRLNSVRQRPLVYYFIFWFNIMNLGNLFDYVPIRVFTTHGDIGHVLFGLNNISPWWVFIPGTYIVLLLYYFFFTSTLIDAYKIICGNKDVPKQACILILAVLTSFVFFALAGLSGYSEICRFISQLSYCVVPAILITNWPTRSWIKNKISP